MPNNNFLSTPHDLFPTMVLVLAHGKISPMEYLQPDNFISGATHFILNGFGPDR
jgi:hypothetical protein